MQLLHRLLHYFPVKEMIAHALDLLIILMPFSDDRDDIAIFRMGQAVLNRFAAIRDFNVFAIGFCKSDLDICQNIFHFLKAGLSAVMIDRSASFPPISPIEYRRSRARLPPHPKTQTRRFGL